MIRNKFVIATVLFCIFSFAISLLFNYLDDQPFTGMFFLKRTVAMIISGAIFYFLLSPAGPFSKKKN